MVISPLLQSQQSDSLRVGSLVQPILTGTHHDTARPVLNVQGQPTIDTSAARIFRQMAIRDSVSNAQAGQAARQKARAARRTRIKEQQKQGSIQAAQRAQANDTLVVHQDSLQVDSLTVVRDTLHQDTLTTGLPMIPLGKEGKEFVSVRQDWLLGVILVALILFASVRLVFNKYLSHLMVSLINYSTASRLFRERGYKMSHGSFRLDVMSLLVTSIFVYQLSSHDGSFTWPGLGGYKLLLAYFGLLGAYGIGKLILYHLTGALFMKSPVVSEVFFNYGIYTRALGVFLLPIIIVVSLAPEWSKIMFVAGISITVVLYAASLIRGALVALKNGISIFYLILYLCTLEIFPLLLVYKLIFGQV
jgi:hypothetical protein